MTKKESKLKIMLKFRKAEASIESCRFVIIKTSFWEWNTLRK
jgi:hypothetical protein